MIGPVRHRAPAASMLTAGLAILAAGSALPAETVDLRSAGGKVTVTRGDIAMVFDASGGGLVTSARRGGEEVCSAGESAGAGLFATLIVPGGDTAADLGPVAGKEVAGQVAVKSVAGDKADPGAPGQVDIAGAVAFPGIGDGIFAVKVVIPADGPAMAASAELRLPKEAAGRRLGSFGLAVPLKLRFHPSPKPDTKYDKTTAAAILPRCATPIPEIRRLTDRQDQTSVWGPMLWTLAGIRQSTPLSCQVWEAWTTQNPPFILQQHNVHPGWMAVADSTSAVAAALRGRTGDGIADLAPMEIYCDSQARVLRVCFQSPYCRPRALAGAERLSAGPAYIFLLASQQEALDAAAYGDARRRPALAGIADILPKLAPTQTSLPGAVTGAGAPPGHQPAIPADAPAVPDDPEFASHEPGRPGEIPIWVDGPLEADLDALPITRGVPLARGILRDEKRAALLGPDGAPVPCVARALAWWPDGSIKWLLLDFQAALKARAWRKLKLVVGDKAAPAPVARPLAITSGPGEVAVDTGKLRLTLANRAGRLALGIGVDLNGDGKVSDDETVVRPGGDILGCTFSHIAETEQYRSGQWVDPGQADPGAAEVTELKVEESSPLRAVVLVRANLRHKLLASTIDGRNRPPVGTPVVLRLHLYAGTGLIRLQHTFMFCGDVRHDFLRELGLRLPLPAEVGQAVRTSIDGRLVSLPGRGEGGQCGLLQEDADSAIVWQAPGPQAVAVGRTADGWLDVSNPRWGVTVGLRHMRGMCPQEIHVDGEGVWTHFYPPHVPPMDVRRYAFKYGDGESTSTGWGTAFGAMRTHEAYWHFHAASQGQAEGPARVKAMLDPPLVRIPPRHVADTLAVGHVAEHGAPTNDAHMDAVLHHLPRMHRHNRDFWRWFGFWDFGDEQQVYDSARRRWAKDDGRYGWYNNEPLRDLNYHLAYLMTGSRRIWEAAEAMSWHVLEADVRHANPQPLMSARPRIGDAAYSNSTTSGIDICGRRHNCQHWSDGYFGPRVGSPAGFRLAYYQTGDPALREHLDRLLAAAMKMRRSQYMAADGDEAVLWAMLMGHEMTRDASYLDRINGYVNLQVEFARTSGGLPAAQANWDWAMNRPGAPPGDPRGDLWIWSFGGSLGLIEAADLWPDAARERFLVNWVLALEGKGPDGKRRDAWSNHMAACPLLAYYYRRTGDGQALDWFKQRLKGFHSGIPKDAPTEDLPPAVMADTLPAYTPNDGYGWVYTTTTFWYVGIPAWQGALRARAAR